MPFSFTIGSPALMLVLIAIVMCISLVKQLFSKH
jgi:hypothetical protein